LIKLVAGGQAVLIPWGDSAIWALSSSQELIAPGHREAAIGTH
jgi:hypothetical protein